MVQEKFKPTIKEVKAKLLPPLPAEIAGTWVDENEPGHKLEFATDGTVKIYSQNVAILSSTFEITDTCDGQTFDGNYLKIVNDDDGTDMCFYIHGINADDSGILSITPSGKSSLQTYQNQ